MWNAEFTQVLPQEPGPVLTILGDGLCEHLRRSVNSPHRINAGPQEVLDEDPRPAPDVDRGTEVEPVSIDDPVEGLPNFPKGLLAEQLVVVRGEPLVGRNLRGAGDVNAGAGLR